MKYLSLTETKQYLKLNGKLGCHVASLRYTSSSVDLSKLLLVAKVTGLPFGLCRVLFYATVMANRAHANTVLRTTQENSSNAKHAFKLSVYRTYIYSVFI